MNKISILTLISLVSFTGSLWADKNDEKLPLGVYEGSLIFGSFNYPTLATFNQGGTAEIVFPNAAGANPTTGRTPFYFQCEESRHGTFTCNGRAYGCYLPSVVASGLGACYVKHPIVIAKCVDKRCRTITGSTTDMTFAIDPNTGNPSTTGVSDGAPVNFVLTQIQ
jgi:hypothetical protein